MSILSTDTTFALSDASMIYPVDQFGGDELSVDSYIVGSYAIMFDFPLPTLIFLTKLSTSYNVAQEPNTFGNVVNALWPLPVDLGNQLLDDLHQMVYPNDYFAQDTVA
jgi:hypothetical protein